MTKVLVERDVTTPPKKEGRYVTKIKDTSHYYTSFYSVPDGGWPKDVIAWFEEREIPTETDVHRWLLDSHELPTIKKDDNVNPNFYWAMKAYNFILDKLK